MVSVASKLQKKLTSNDSIVTIFGETISFGMIRFRANFYADRNSQYLDAHFWITKMKPFDPHSSEWTFTVLETNVQIWKTGV